MVPARRNASARSARRHERTGGEVTRPWCDSSTAPSRTEPDPFRAPEIRHVRRKPAVRADERRTGRGLSVDFGVLRQCPPECRPFRSPEGFELPEPGSDEP
ncbi:hypothetical protein ADL06_29830 [Streptomyces sp. NRRL F-6491]|nr:hypothetical protein ADL06_29830 [Streptomyces sp. NRRL F-6491]KOX37077.1 hypothetical protein ADL08_30490 [Streptomyces sp. NRRL F-6492]